MKVSEVLAFNLKRLRKAKGWTQEFLAEKADLSVPTVNQLENKNKFCGLETLSKLAKALKVEESELFKDSSLFDPATAMEVLSQFIESAKKSK